MPLKAHPRSRGENEPGDCVGHCLAGSSPLTRGKLQAPGRAQPRGGLIPAHAGKTWVTNWCRSLRWAHPRSRGENARGGDKVGAFLGSSPLTRGKQARALGWTRPARLIPAHAGKTQELAAERASTTAHPRSRGENPVALGFSLILSGSSPLTRGKHREARMSQVMERLIPAHAGKTRRVQGKHSRRPAHPRSRGENNTRGHVNSNVPGSSPLTRGKL